MGVEDVSKSKAEKRFTTVRLETKTLHFKVYYKAWTKF